MNAHDRRPTARSAIPLAALAALLATPPACAKDANGPIALGTPKSLASAIAAIEKATGSKAADLELKGNPLRADEGRSFRIQGRVATRLLEGSHESFLKGGLYLFRLERSFGMGGGLDVVGLVKTTDREALLRRVGTSDPSKQKGTDQILSWLAELQQGDPFFLDEIGVDYVAGHFAKVPANPRAIAERCAEIAPELVKGSGSAIDLLTEEIRSNRTLYLIW